MGMTHFGGPLRVGNFFGRNGNADEPGALTSEIYCYDVVPAIFDVDGVAAAQAIAGAQNALINGLLASNGVATMDIPRGLEVDSSDNGDTTQTVLITGTDFYGRAQSELIALNGTTAVAGTKTFKTVISAAVSAAMAGNLTIGTTDVLGLPYRVNSRNYVLTAWDGAFVTTGTFAAADATAATTTTDDVRGTYDPPTDTDGTRRLTAWIFVKDPNTRAGLYGVVPA